MSRYDLSPRRYINSFNPDEERLRLIADNLQDLICAHDRKGALIYISPSIWRILGYEPGDFIGENPLPIIHPFDAAKIKSFNFVKNVISGRIKKFEFRIRTKKGEYVWFETLIKLIRDSKDKISEVITTSRDITQRKDSEEEIQRLTLNLENIVQERTAQLLKTNEDLYREIDERKAAEKALKKSAEFYHAVSELVSDFIYIARVEEGHCFAVDWMSDSFAKISSYDPLDMKCLADIAKVFHPDDMEPYMLAKKRMAQSGIGEELEYRVVAANGETRYLIEHNLPIFDDAKNKVTRIYSAARDFTERRVFVNELLKLNLAIEASTDYIFITNKDMVIEYANKAFENLLEKSRIEILGKRPGDLLQSDALPKDFLETFIRNLRSGKPFRFEAAGKKKNGEIYFTEELVAPVFDSKGEIEHYISTGRDITERKKYEQELYNYRNHLEKLVEERTTELRYINNKLADEVHERITIAEALQESEARLRLITDNIQDLITVTDPQGLITYMSQSVYDLLGFHAEELIGRNAYEIIHPDDAEKILKRREKHRQERTDFKFDYRLRKKNGEYIWVETILRYIYDDKGSLLEGQSSSRDITHRKLAEEEVLKAYEQEKKLNELKSRLVSTISHEFRTPLTAIFASAEMLERYGSKWTDEKKHENIKRIQNSVEHMIEMLNETLSMSKADAGKINFAPAQFEVVSFCKVIIDELSIIKTDAHSLTFTCASEHISFNQDSKLLAIVITNLISNAIKYSPNGGEINVSLMERDGGLIFTVSDQGIGIDDKDLREIFQPFFRGKNIGNIKGTGLGLSIVKKYIEIIGGTIEFQSELGKGSRVIVDVPSIN